MEYRIIFTDTVEGVSTPGQKKFGYEVQPPLSEAAIQGVVGLIKARRSKMMVRSPKDGEAGNIYAVRSDTEGTAFIAEPGDHTVTAEAIARQIGAIIDPCGLHSATYEPASKEG